MTRFSGPAVPVDAEPVPAAAAPMPIGSLEPSRAVAVMPAEGLPNASLSAVVVRGRERSTTAPMVQHGSSRPGDVTLNFAGADIRDVINEVLGETLRLNFVIDPEVTGPVSFNVSRPLAREELLPTLEAVLNSRGATMVKVNGLIRVMPQHKDGKLAAAAPLEHGSVSAIGEGTDVFPLRFIAASDMQRVLEKVLPPGRAVSPDDRRHLVVVQGSPTERQLAKDVIRIFDVDQLSGMSMALVPLRHADPSALAGELANIFAATRKEADSGAIRFMGIGRLNSIMIISRSPQYMDEARAWAARLDRSGDLNERRVYVYNLQYGKAVQVGQKLQGLLSNLDIQFRPPTATGSPDAGSLAVAAAADQGNTAGRTADLASLTAAATGEPGVVAVKPSDPKLSPSEPAAPLPAVARPADNGGSRNGVRIEADEAHNALLISANARDFELIRHVLQGIDVPPLQVMIEVTVAEVQLNDQLNYGVEYFINSGRINNLLTSGTKASGIASALPGYALSWVTGKFDPRAILDALSKVTETRVISTPRLLVLSNQTARLQVGDVVPIITQSATSTVTSNSLVLNNVSYKETGVVLEVTPRVNSGGVVTIDVSQSVSDVINTTTSTIDSPTIRQRRLASTISVKSGDAILLGGLIQQKSDRKASGIPVLSELPAIGALFGDRSNAADRTELIMLMTPRVIASDDAARDVTARVGREFQAVLDGRTMQRPRPVPR